MSIRYELFQVNYPKLVASQVLISVRDVASPNLKIILDGLKFRNSSWIFFGVEVEIFNCDAAFLSLELQHLNHAAIQNCTFGNWTFRKVQNAFIKNGNIVFHNSIAASLTFLNSSVFLENITMENQIIDFNGIFIKHKSLLYVEQSKFINNTAKQGIIKALKSSSLIMSNCTVLENYAAEYPGVIAANESSVHLKNTYFYKNMAIKGAGAILIENMSFLQIKNCTFKNNSVDRVIGIGGAIFSLNNSLIDISCSVFDGNKGALGGGIQLKTSKAKLNQCSFFRNFGTAVAGLEYCEISIMNSIFQNNLAEYESGAITVREKSLLNVSNTTFDNNSHNISTDMINMYQIPFSTRSIGGGAVYIETSVGNISKTRFRNNYSSYWCGSMAAFNSSLSISNTIFENNVADVSGGAICANNSTMNIEYSTFNNNSILDKIFGSGGSLYLGNSTTKISNVIISKCHANKGAAISGFSSKIIMSSSSLIANTGSAIFFIIKTL